MLRHQIVAVSTLSNCTTEILQVTTGCAVTCTGKLVRSQESSFDRLTYTEAVKILEQSGKSFEFPVKWGSTCSPSTSAS